MTDEDKMISIAKEKLRALAAAIGKPEVDLDQLQYKFLENCVVLTNKGHLVGMIHRQVYDALMRQALDADSE